jgi:hypothetical protein
MNQVKKGFDTDLRSLLKNQHRKVYSICRFFATNYKEHQQLFANMISAASQNIRFLMGKEDKQTLMLRACINMAALHSITLDIEGAGDRSIKFKSTDYQRSMQNFQDSVREMNDLDKFRLFLEFENISGDEITGLLGPVSWQQQQRESAPVTAVKKNFLPSLKDKLAWT